MARFYQTAQRNFQDDFIFQPNMDIVNMALAKKDNDIKNQVETLNLFDNLPVDYWKEADQDNVAQIKEQYSNRVSDIVAQMQKDVTNTGANTRLINSLRRDIQNDYEFGNIRNIQDNAKAYKQYDEMLKSLPNPADREAYKAQISNYLLNNPKGALSQKFTPDEMYNTRDLWGEFTNSSAFKSLHPDEKSSQVVNSNGKWLVKKGNQVQQLSESKIGQAFKAFIDSNNLQGYGNSRQKYFGENWLDENGNVSLADNSYLGNLMGNGISSLAYTKSASSQDMNADPYGLAGYQASLQEAAAIRAEKRAAKAAQVSNIEYGDSNSKRVLNSQLFKAQKDEIVNNKMNILSQALGMPVTLQNIPKLIEIANKNKNTAMAKQLGSILATNQEGVRASYAPLYELGASKAFVDQYQKNLQNAIQTKGDNVKGVLDLTGAGFGGNSTLTKNRSLNEIKGNTIGNYRVKEAEIVPNSSSPMFFGYDETKNQIQSSVKLTLVPINSQDDNVEEITKTVDFYQPSANITGTSSIDKDIINKYSR